MPMMDTCTWLIQVVIRCKYPSWALEGQGFARTIQKSIFIRVNNPFLLKNIGMYNHPYIWDAILNNT